MKKSTKIILLIVVVLLIIGLIVLFAVKNSHSDAHKVKNSDAEIKDILKKEKEFLEAEHVHQEFLDVKEFKASKLDIEWVEKTKIVNIGGNPVNAYVAIDDEMGEPDEYYILAEDGTLYRAKEGKYSVMKPTVKVNKVGVYFVRNGGECQVHTQYVADTDDGIYYFDSNNETGKVSIKKLSEVREFTMPVCYSGDKTKFENYGRTSTEGQFNFDGLVLKDKVTKKELVVKWIVYAENGGVDKYYVITEDDTLYVVEEEQEYVEAVAKVTFKYTKVGEDSKDVKIEIQYEDILINLKDVLNNSN